MRLVGSIPMHFRHFFKLGELSIAADSLSVGTAVESIVRSDGCQELADPVPFPGASIGCVERGNPSDLQSSSMSAFRAGI